jgi:hypothetical protein
MSNVDFSKQQRDNQMYGISEDQLKQLIERSTMHNESGLMLAAGMLSDCQEVLEYLDDGNECDREIIRKTLNRAKYIIFEYMDKHNVR